MIEDVATQVNKQYQSVSDNGVLRAPAFSSREVLVPGQSQTQSQEQGSAFAKDLWTTTYVSEELQTSLLPRSVAELATVGSVGTWHKIMVQMAIIDGRYLVLNGHDELRVAAEQGLLVDWQLVPEVTTIDEAKAWRERKHPLRRKSSSPEESAARGRAVLGMPGLYQANPRVLQLFSNLFRVNIDQLANDVAMVRLQSSESAMPAGGETKPLANANVFQLSGEHVVTNAQATLAYNGGNGSENDGPPPSSKPPRRLPPLLKFPGGKTSLVEHVAPLFEPYKSRLYVEPFCGALGMCLGLQPEKALLADLNPALINFHKQVQGGLVFDMEMRFESVLYYAARDRFNELFSRSEWSAETAQLLFFLNRSGFNGLMRFSQEGTYNVPIGRYKRVSYERSLGPYAEAFAPWQFECRPFESVALPSGSFVYADPPYDGGFTEYVPGPRFNFAQQERLAAILAAHDGPVVASNAATPRILELYKRRGFDVRVINVARRIACNGNRKPAEEMLATKGV